MTSPEARATSLTGRLRAAGQAVRRSAREGSLRSNALRAASGHARFGSCPVCDRTVVFLAGSDWLRDSYRCLRCDSIPRQRALMAVLQEVAPDWRTLRIHESSPDGASSRRIAALCPGYEASQYWPDVAPGSLRGGVRCEDLTRLTFGDEAFDMFITQDVFEHVLDPERAFAEVARVLRPGGLHVFTVPWYRGRETLVRARGREGAIDYREEPNYHSNPVDPDGSLVATEWGDDLPEVISAGSGLQTTPHAINDPGRGIVGEFTEVMVSRKPG